MQLGKYEVIEEIGQGGFGIVYKANDQTLDRLVALKVLHPQLTVDTRFIENFRKEARLMAKITHPNVVTVYEVGEVEGRVFIAMQYLPGGNLEEKITNDGPIPFEEALEISRQITKALEAGYKHKLIHRDVKPANILFDEDGNALLGDFGVAHTVQISSQGTTSQSGIGVGTPSYRPPELWNGTPPPSQATDQYSLACVFYEMLSGDKLFGGETTEQIMVKLLIQEPDLDNLESEELKVILKKAIAKNPTDRFGSLEEFQKALTESDSQNAADKESSEVILSNKKADEILIGSNSVEDSVEKKSSSTGEREFIKQDSNFAAVEHDLHFEGTSPQGGLRKSLKDELLDLKIKHSNIDLEKNKKTEDVNQAVKGWKPKTWQILVFSFILVFWFSLFEGAYKIYNGINPMVYYMNWVFPLAGTIIAVLHYNKNHNFPFAIKIVLDVTCFSLPLYLVGGVIGIILNYGNGHYKSWLLVCWMLLFGYACMLFLWIYHNYILQELPILSSIDKKQHNQTESIKNALLIQMLLFVFTMVPIFLIVYGDINLPVNLFWFQWEMQGRWEFYLWLFWVGFSVIWWIMSFDKVANKNKLAE